MELNSIYMHRCLFLAGKGEGFTKPNPMVGAVIVHKNKIIGEGYHRQFGKAHAEVNAINSVKNKSLLKDSTMYVSLEPCSHHGKTPPCAELIISSKIPRVVIAVRDPNPNVAGKGVEMMKNNGIEVSEGLLEAEAREINRFFFVNQLLSRPYIILKWAQSKDGFIDFHRKPGENKLPVILSNKLTHSIVHKLRTEVQGILVGTNTAILDNPKLSARKWFGYDPTRIVIDRDNKIPLDSALFDGKVPTIVFTASIPHNRENSDHLTFIEIDFTKDTNNQILKHLYIRKIYSVLVEGGANLLSSFINKNLWDEAFIEVSETKLYKGVSSPEIKGSVTGIKRYLGSTQYYLKSKISRNFL